MFMCVWGGGEGGGVRGGAGARGGVTETWKRATIAIITRGEEGGWLVVVRGGERRCRCPWWCHRDLEKGERKQQ